MLAIELLMHEGRTGSTPHLLGAPAQLMGSSIALHAPMPERLRRDSRSRRRPWMRADANG